MKNRIFFLSPDNKKATGGVKQLYRQVDILNKNGFEAYILHKNVGHRSSFFKNDTKIKYNSKIFNDIKFLLREKKATTQFKKNKLILKKGFNFILSFLKSSLEVKLKDSDILVFPEIYGFAISEVKRKLVKVIFNQNCYYSFEHFQFDSKTNLIPYINNNTYATIVASDDAYRYMQFSFPELNLFKLRLGIDKEIFNYSNKKNKKIAFMPRKLEEDVIQVINILKCRSKFFNWEFVPIENKNEIEVAEILKQSIFFLSFNHREGFGLPPAEAMACGCVVIGYSGQGGLEYFNDEFSFKVSDRNIIEFAEKIEFALNQYELNSEKIKNMGKIASKFILEKYSIKNEENDIIDIWNKIN